MSLYIRKQAHRATHKRIRRKISGTGERPRLAVHFSGQHVYAQLIDDTNGITIASASTMEKDSGAKGSNIAAATKVGQALAERGRAKSISKVVFDRGGFVYHGKVKALADAAREAGLEF